MSQKKVDSYKAAKAGRSKAYRNEKMIDKLEISCMDCNLCGNGWMDWIFRVCKDRD